MNNKTKSISKLLTTTFVVCVESRFVMGSRIDFEIRRYIRQHQTHKADGTKEKGAGSNFERSVDGCWRTSRAGNVWGLDF